MRTGLVGRTDRKDALEIAEGVARFLEGKTEILFEKELALKLKKKQSNLVGADIIIVIGGDGTILRALQFYNKPVLGIKAGAVGFLAELQEIEKLESALSKILACEYEVDSRIKLKTILGKARLPDAVNEVVLHSSKIAKICNFKLQINSDVYEIVADGIIVATPTGSTSYAFSVGAPIIGKNLKAFVIAPIAPFRQITKPLVVSADSKIKVSLVRGRGWSLAIDGQYEQRLGMRDNVIINLSDKEAQFIRVK